MLCRKAFSKMSGLECLAGRVRLGCLCVSQSYVLLANGYFGNMPRSWVLWG